MPPDVSRGAAQVIGRCAQAVARGGARCAPRVLIVVHNMRRTTLLMSSEKE
jgi:hypothetical protein